MTFEVASIGEAKRVEREIALLRSVKESVRCLCVSVESAGRTHAYWAGLHLGLEMAISDMEDR